MLTGVTYRLGQIPDHIAVTIFWEDRTWVVLDGSRGRRLVPVEAYHSDGVLVILGGVVSAYFFDSQPANPLMIVEVI